MAYYDALAHLMQCVMQSNHTPAPPATPTGSTWSFSDEIWSQTVVATAIAAKTILDEDPETANHANRVKWAKWVLMNLFRIAPIYAYGVVEDATIIANGTDPSSDAEVQAALDALIATLVAGVPS